MVETLPHNNIIIFTNSHSLLKEIRNIYTKNNVIHIVQYKITNDKNKHVIMSTPKDPNSKVASTATNIAKQPPI